MIALSDLTRFLDQELRLAEVPDYSGAMNGLQLENSGEISFVAAAVDASLSVIEGAIAAGADLLLVHHGMFWQGAQPVTKAFYRKIKLAMEADLAIYSAHLPLDVHPSLGNNALLMRALGFEPEGAFMNYKGLATGLTATVDLPLSDLVNRVEAAVAGSAHVCPGGADRVRKLGVVTGGAGSEVAAAAAAGVDTFLTGEGPHWSYPLAEELGINVIYAGHYATETFGVKALAETLEKNYQLPWSFIHRPTGL